MNPIICQNPKCNAENPPDSNFCYKCGRKLEVKRKHECGCELSGTEEYCPHCGKKIASPAVGGITGTAQGDGAIGQKSEPASGTTPTQNVEWDEGMQRRKLVEVVSREQQILRELNLSQYTDFAERCKVLCNAIARFVDQVEQEVPPALRGGLVAMLLSTPVGFLIIARSRGQVIPEGELPPRFRQLWDENGNLCQSGVEIETAGLQMRTAGSWICEAISPTVLEESFKGRSKELQEVYLETMRERFFLEETTVALKKRFLTEEQIRLDHGYYANELVPALRDLRQKLLVMEEKVEREFSSRPPGFEKDNLVRQLAPLASLENMEGVMTAASAMGLGDFPFKYEPLTTSQDQLMDLLLAEGLRGIHGQEILSFLEGLRLAAEQNADTWISWFQSSLAHYRGDQANMTRALAVLFEQAHIFLTCCCNILRRRVRSAQDQELPLRAANPLNQLVVDAVRKAEPELFLALNQGFKSVGKLAHEQALAQKNVPQAATPTQPAAIKAEVHLFPPTTKGGRSKPIFPGYRCNLLGSQMADGMGGKKMGLTFPVELVDFQQLQPGESGLVSIRLVYENEEHTPMNRGDKLRIFEDTGQPSSDADLAALGATEIANVGELEIV